MADSNKHTPLLRFPEFLNDGEWKEHTFSDVFTFVPNNTLSRANLNNENGSVQNIHYGDILIKFGEYLNVQTEHLPFISNVQDIERYRKAKLANGDVIIADTAEDETVGKCTELVGIADEFIVSGLHTIAVRPNNTFATGYLGFYMNSNSYREQLKRVMQGVKVLSVSKTAISQTRLHFPSSRIEQGRIADCLTFLDSYIYDTKSKLKQLKAHKRGLMQRLFPTKGKTVPELRFTEFRNDGEWEIKKLRDIATFSKGKGISKTDVTANGTTPCIRYGELYTTYKETITDVSSYTDLPVTDLFLSKANDVIIPSSGETKEDIATASCIIKDGIAIGGDINVIRTSNNGIFLSYYLTYVKKNDIARIAQGVSIIHLYNEQLRDLVVELPNSIKEQQRIADCLQSVDNVIKSYEDKITALELHKKGLMQQLFPKL